MIPDRRVWLPTPACVIFCCALEQGTLRGQAIKVIITSHDFGPDYALGEVRDPWNTGTEETFKLLPSWWPYSLAMWLWILYLWATVLSVNRKNLCRSEKNVSTFFVFETSILQSFSDLPEALRAGVWEGLVNGSHTANAPLLICSPVTILRKPCNKQTCLTY